MPIKKSALIVVVVLLVCLLTIAFTILNVGHTVTNSDGYVTTVRFSDPEFDNWSRLGLQLHYSYGNEEAAKLFIEDIAKLLQSKGIGEILILGPYVDLQALEQDLEGVFIFHVDVRSGGWYFSRQGSVSAAAEFIPLKKGSLAAMNVGSATSASGRGWFNKAHFESELRDAAAGYWVQEALRNINLIDHQGEAGPDTNYIESNIDGIPPALSGLLTGDGNLQTLITHGDNYVLSYITANQDLEDILESEFTGQHNMKVALSWVDAAGGRRLTELISEENSQEVRIFYSDSAKLPFSRGFESPISSGSVKAEYLVTIISLKR